MSRRPDDNWRRLADAETRATLRDLPADLRARVADLPVRFEQRPSRALRDDGWPANLLGLFEGPAYGEGAAAFPLPPGIRLFIDNLRDEAADDPARFRQEVRTTLLHEIGHYLGLDEDGLAARGLE